MYRVIAADEFSKELSVLKREAELGNGGSAQLVKLVEKGIEKLKYDYQYGSHISKNKIPTEYLTKYGVENLWKLDLSSNWRMIYTVRGTEIEVLSIILEVLDHKKYDRKFGYKTS
jgi:mRNA-degrading endonuclease RelE of RelBE toxin-antitoxin system